MDMDMDAETDLFILKMKLGGLSDPSKQISAAQPSGKIAAWYQTPQNKFPRGA
jgi:hypothetical protein